MTSENTTESKFNTLFAYIVIPACLAVAILIFVFLMGHESNFMDAEKTMPKKGNYLGIIYKGGLIVPVLMSFFLMVITFSVERFLTFYQATGRGSLKDFVKVVKQKLLVSDVGGAKAACNYYQGTVGNVGRSALERLQIIQQRPDLTPEQKAAEIQKEVDDSTGLELPILEKNLPIIATLASVSTLVGLLGTVIGMVKAFSAIDMGGGGADTAALATGISEALINTALGIASSALAIISYNYFTNRIDTLTQGIDEIGFSVSQTVAKSTPPKVPAAN